MGVSVGVPEGVELGVRVAVEVGVLEGVGVKVKVAVTRMVTGVQVEVGVEDGVELEVRVGLEVGVPVETAVKVLVGAAGVSGETGLFLDGQPARNKAKARAPRGAAEVLVNDFTLGPKNMGRDLSHRDGEILGEEVFALKGFNGSFGSQPRLNLFSMRPHESGWGTRDGGAGSVVKFSLFSYSGLV